MNRGVLLFGRSALVAAATFLVGDSFADVPHVVRSYRFIPAHSTLGRTGGFAGFHDTFSIFGTFDLDFGPEVSIPENVPPVTFENVESWLVPHSPLTYVLDTDRTLNLSGLEGRPPFGNHVVFKGLDGQGQPLTLDAKFAGRLLHLVGANDPGCCDFFNYKVDAFAHLLPFADFNSDSVVDAADYTTWRDHLGLKSNATLEQGDADGDGDVDNDDYAAWLHDVGATIDMSALTNLGSGGAAGVSEPASLGLAAAGLVLLTIRRRLRFPLF